MSAPASSHEVSRATVKALSDAYAYLAQLGRQSREAPRANEVAAETVQVSTAKEAR